MSSPHIDSGVEKKFQKVHSIIGDLSNRKSLKELDNSSQKIHAILTSLRLQFARINSTNTPTRQPYDGYVNHAIHLTQRNVRTLKQASADYQEEAYNVYIDSIRSELLRLKCEVVVDIPEPTVPSKPPLKSIQAITPSLFYNYHLKTPGLFAHLTFDRKLNTIVKELTALNSFVTFNKILRFGIDALDLIPQEYPHEFNAQDIENFELIRTKIIKSSRLQELVEYYASIANRSVDRNLDALHTLSKTLFTHLNDLATGETFPFFWGWNVQGSAGHKMLIEFKKIEDTKKTDVIYHLKVFTTGAGAQFHSQENNGASRYLDVIREYRISHEELAEDLALRLFEPLIFYNCSEVMDKNGVYCENTLYTLLRRYAIPLPSHIEKINEQKILQVSNTCMMNIIIAYIYHKSPKGKLFKNLWERLSIKLFFKNFSSRQSSLYDPLWQLLLSRVIPNLYAHLEKNIKSGSSPEFVQRTLLELNCFQTEYEKIFHDPVNTNSSLDGFVLQPYTLFKYPSPPKVTQQQPKSSVNPLAMSYTFFRLEHDVEADEICDNLLKLVNIISTPEGKIVENIPFFTSQIRSLGRFFTLQNKKTFFDSFRSQIVFSEMFIRLLNDVNSEIFVLAQKKKIDPYERLDIVIMNMFCIMMVYQISEILDDQALFIGQERIDYYKFPPLRSFGNIFHNSSIPIFNPQDEKDCELLSKFFNFGNKDKSKKRKTLPKDGLFNFVHAFYRSKFQIPNSSTIHLLHLQKGSDHYKYLHAHYKKIPTERFYVEDQDFIKKKKDSSNSSVTQDEWRIHSLLINDLLPLQFRILNDLVLYNHYFSPCYNKDITENLHFSQLRLVGSLHIPLIEFHGSKSYFNPKENRESLVRFPKEMGNEETCRKFISGLQKKQNELLKEEVLKRRDILSIVAQKSELQIISALEYFKQNPQNLIQAEERIIFSHILLLPHMVSKTLLSIPLFEQMFDSAFVALMDFFTIKNCPHIKKSDCITVFLFLLEHKIHVLNKIQSIKKTKSYPPIIAERNRITQTLQQDDFRDKPSQMHLRMILIASFNIDQHLDLHLINQFVYSIGILGIYKAQGIENKNISPYFSHGVYEIIFNKAEFIGSHYLQTIQVVEDILKLYGIKLPLKYDCPYFPYIDFSLQSDMYRYNILLGELYKNGSTVNLGLVPSEYLNCEIYKMLFGNKRILAIPNDDFFETYYHGKRVLFKNGTYKIESNEWYTCSTTAFYNVKKLPDTKHLLLWISHNAPQANSIVIDTRTGHIVYHIDHKGYYSFPKNLNKKYELSKFSSGDFKKFYLEPLLFVEVTPKGDKEMILLYPNYRNEQEEVLKFNYINKKWVLSSNPSLLISSTQTLQGLRDFTTYLILENSVTHEQEVLVPVLNFAYFLKMKDRNVSAFNGVVTKCLALKMENKKIAIQGDTIKNAFAAYLKFTHALVPEHYYSVKQHLLACKEFRSFTGDELIYLGWLYTESGKIDMTAEAFAIKLLTIILLHKNFALYAKQDKKKKDALEQLSDTSVPGYNEPAISWEHFFRNDQTYRSTIIKNYLLRKNDIPETLKVDLHFNTLDRDIVKWWDPFLVHASYPPELPPSGLVLKHFQLEDHPYLLKQAFKSYHPCHTRQGKHFNLYFGYFYQIALSHSLADRKKLKNFLYYAQHDTYLDNPTLRTLLWAVLMGTDPQFSDIYHVKEGFQAVTKFFANPQSINFENAQEILADKVMEFSNHLDTLIHNDFVSETVLRMKTKDYFSPTIAHTTLPTSIPSMEKAIKSPPNLFSHYIKKYTHYFTTPPPKEDNVDPIVFSSPTMSAYETEMLKELNEDIKIGRKINLQLSDVVLKKSLKETIHDFLHIEKTELNNLLLEHQSKMAILEKNILEEVNFNFTNVLQPKISVGAHHSRLFTIEDCIDYYFQQDIKKFQIATQGLEITRLLGINQLVGVYLLHSVQSIHISTILEEIGNLNKSYEPRVNTATLIKISQILRKTHPVSDLQYAHIVLVFEHRLQMVLYDSQVEGLIKLAKHEMSSKQFTDVFLQLPPGTGKTDIIGRLIAMLNADGYHLSIYMTPLHQFASTINDSAEKSLKVFNQELIPLIYYEFGDDTAEAAKYVKYITAKLREAIPNKNFVYTTKEYLRSYLTRFLKISIDSFRDNIKYREEERSSLKELHILLRERGKNVWDEQQQATRCTDELSMTCGEPVYLNKNQIELVGKLLKLSALAKDIQDILLINFKDNQQAKQTESQKYQMLTLIATQILLDKVWSKRLGITPHAQDDKFIKLRDYILNPKYEMPAFLASSKCQENKETTAADLAILLHLLIARDWLGENLGKSVNEHFSIQDKESSLPIAIPNISHLKPAENSEFSHPITLITLSYIAYIVNGLKSEQVMDFISYQRIKIQNEWDTLKLETPDIPSSQTPTYKLLQEFSTSIGLKNNLVNYSQIDDDLLLNIKQGLGENNDVALRLVIDYVGNRILALVKIYVEEVTSHAQNTATITKHLVGFSASMSLTDVAPLMDYTGRRVAMLQEKGTNGQTLDLYIRKNPTIFVIDSNYKSLFTEILHDTKNEPRFKNVRAIIDLYCFFNGKKTHEVAQMIAENNKNPDIKVVVFFNQDSDELSYIRVDYPTKINPIKGTTQKNILSQTNCERHNIFYFLDKERSTATNIKMIPQAIAIITFGVGVMFDDFIQAGKRMREWYLLQDVVIALDQKGLTKISNLSYKPYISSLAGGKVTHPKALMMDLILYAYLNMINKDKKEKFTICMQHLDNLPRQFLLDCLYKGKITDYDTFNRGADFFVKKVSYDLYNAYANKTENISIQKFFEILIDSIQTNLRLISKHVNIEQKDISKLKETMTTLVTKSLPGMAKEIEVHPDFIRSGIKGLNLTRLDNVRVHIRETMSTKENQNETISTVVKGQCNVVEEIDIHLIQSLYVNKSRNSHIINLNEYISNLLPGFSNVFLRNIFFSRNTHLSKESLGGALQDPSQIFVKPFHELLLVRDFDDNVPFYKLVIGSSKDFDMLIKMSENPNQAFVMIPNRCTGWIIKANGELIKSIGRDGFYSVTEVNSHVSYNSMLLQAMFIGGNLSYLKKKEWIKELQQWLKGLKIEQRMVLKAWFEKSMSNYGLAVEYHSSPVARVWDV